MSAGEGNDVEIFPCDAVPVSEDSRGTIAMGERTIRRECRMVVERRTLVIPTKNGLMKIIRRKTNSNTNPDVGVLLAVCLKADYLLIGHFSGVFLW
jgi:hypothetical protein